MRFDKPNKITGQKTFVNLDVDVLKLQKHINIQGVDILNFTTKAILKHGNYKFGGKPILESASFENGLR